MCIVEHESVQGAVEITAIMQVDADDELVVLAPLLLMLSLA